MMKSPAGRYPFSRFMASPSRAKRSELEHDSLASMLPGSIGGEAVVANMDGPAPRSHHAARWRGCRVAARGAREGPPAFHLACKLGLTTIGPVPSFARRQRTGPRPSLV